MALLNLFPPYLIVLTLVLVIFPTVLAVRIRIALYKHIQKSTAKVNRLIRGESRGVQPKIIYNLENRFKIASSQLDDVNTAALVDGLYHEEQFTFMSKSLSCEKWDYFVRVLPNLLLAFGLLGTFLGITLNLTGISTLIDINNVDLQSLGEKIKTPLESMGIAFITSLIGLACSSVLTVINLIFNTHLAKVNLISSLEDYLDNILQPTVEGNSRLDKAVNRMVDTQQAFLTNFHTEVTRVLESSLEKVAKKIDDGNQETAKLVTQVCERLTETAGTLSTGATTFKSSTNSFEENVNKLYKAIHHENFVKYGQSLDNCISNFKSTVDKLVNSQVTDNLVATSEKLYSTHAKLCLTVEHIDSLTKLMSQATDNVHNTFKSLVSVEAEIKNLGQSSLSIRKESQNLNIVLNERTEQLLISLQSIQNNLLETTHNINNNSDQLTALGDRLSRLISQEVGRNNYQGEIIAEKSQQTVSYLRDIQAILNQIINLSNQQKNSFLSEMEKEINQVSDSIKKPF
jgi:hypothetical protein